MILVRNVFRLKFGKAKEAVGVLKEGMALTKKLGGADTSFRILTDMTGLEKLMPMRDQLPNLAKFYVVGSAPIPASCNAFNSVLRLSSPPRLQRSNLGSLGSR